MIKLKTVKIPFEQGFDPMFIGTISEDGKTIRASHLLILKNFSVIDGSINWTVSDERGRYVSGGRGMSSLPGTDISLCPSVPITLHNRDRALAPEFIFSVPYPLQVYPLSSVKKKYPFSNKKIHKLLG